MSEDCPKCKGCYSVEVGYNAEWGDWFAKCRDCGADLEVDVMVTEKGKSKIPVLEERLSRERLQDE